MEVYLNLSVTSEEFFNFLYESIINDVKQSTNQTITRNNIVSGYNYTKTLKTKMGRDAKVKVVIKEFILNEKYVATFNNNQGSNVVSYEVESLDDNTIDITYAEEYVGADRLKGMNFNLLNFFFDKKNKKKGIEVLRNIESYIIQNRKGD